MFGWAITRRLGIVIQLTFTVTALSSGAVDALFASLPMARAGDGAPQREHNVSADRQSAPAGNPLWQIPLAFLKVTQERPLFSANRRPAPLAVVAPPVKPPLPSPPAQPPEPDQPPLSLVGTILREDSGIAIFQSGNTDGVVRLKIGESYAGWKSRCPQTEGSDLQQRRSPCDARFSFARCKTRAGNIADRSACSSLAQRCQDYRYFTENQRAVGPRTCVAQRRASSCRFARSLITI